MGTHMEAEPQKVGRPLLKAAIMWRGYKAESRGHVTTRGSRGGGVSKRGWVGSDHVTWGEVGGALEGTREGGGGGGGARGFG